MNRLANVELWEPFIRESWCISVIIYDIVLSDDGSINIILTIDWLFCDSWNVHVSMLLSVFCNFCIYVYVTMMTNVKYTE